MTFMGSEAIEGEAIPEVLALALAQATTRLEVEEEISLEEGEIPLIEIVTERESSRSGTMNNPQGQDHIEVTTDGKNQEETKDWRTHTDQKTPTATQGTTQETTQETKEAIENIGKKRSRPL